MPETRASTASYPHGALPVGTKAGEFEIKRVLGVGGFGIVYLAFDHLLEREVALKEYMPSALVERNETMHVSLISQSNADTFALGLRSFVNEARLLARFDHPSLVKVHRFWEANGTAYMAMALYKGRTVRDVRMEMKERPGEAWVRALLEPLLGAIERLHSEDVFHRDIAPDNILLEGDARPVLLDFGAARRVITDRSQALTAILKPSYAPIEQYADTGGMKQGAWTDIYALGATVHFLLLGKPPPPAPGRSIQDTMPPLARQQLAGCNQPFLELVDWMLSPLPADRPQSVAVVRDALAGRVAPPRAFSFDRTEPMTGPFGATTAALGNEDATFVAPSGGGTDLDLSFADDATVIMPSSGRSAAPPPSGQDAVVRPLPTSYVPPSKVAWPEAPPRPPVADEDATIVNPMPTAFRTGVSAPTPSRVVPPSSSDGSDFGFPPPAGGSSDFDFAPPPVTRGPVSNPPPRPVELPSSVDMASPPTMRVPRLEPGQAPSTPRTVTRTLPPAPRPKNNLAPVVAGVAVAALIGAGLWWFLTRPAAPPVIATPTSPAATTTLPAPTPPAVVPATTPVATVSPDPAPAAPAVAPLSQAEPAPGGPGTTSAATPATTPGTPSAAPVQPATSPRTAEPALRRAEAPPPRGNNAATTNPSLATPSSAYPPPPAPPAARSDVRPTPIPTQSQTPRPPASTDAAPPPAPPVDSRPASPSERCANKLPLERLICVDLACNRSEFARHPECVKLRNDQSQRGSVEGKN